VGGDDSPYAIMSILLVVCVEIITVLTCNIKQFWSMDAIGGRAGGGAEGAVAPPPLADKGANGINPFRRLSGMMPASTEK